jgi:tetratricopeptide (TPR) repeat protein
VLALALCACHEPSGSGASDAPSPAPAAPGYAEELARVDADVERHRAAAGESRDAWPAHERLAQALLERARLSGRFEDHAGAVRAIAAAERLGGPRAGCATRVRVALAVHRLEAARTALAVCRGPPPQVSAVEQTALQADLALHSGRYRDALQLARRVLEQRESPQDLARLALIHEATGAPAEALALLDRAERVDHANTPALRAWLALRRGLLALHRGRWDEALAHYLVAEKRLSGWWLVEEHVAEIHALLGQMAQAATIYRDVLATHPLPELMDAYAQVLRASGQLAEADAWIRRAREAHRGRQELLPEAADGHALGHLLAFEPRARATLELARRDAARRASGDARLALARALLAADRPREAVTVVEAARAAGLDTAETHAVAHDALLRAGLADAARAEAASASAMNPRWRSQYAPH